MKTQYKLENLVPSMGILAKIFTDNWELGSRIFVYQMSQISNNV